MVAALDQANGQPNGQISPEEFQRMLDMQCPYHKNHKHSARDCFALRRAFRTGGNRPPQNKKDDHPPRRGREDPQPDDFQDADRVVNMIFGGPEAFESKRQQKLTARQVLHAAELPTPEYLRWSEVPITFSRADHPGFVPKPGRYALVVAPTIRNNKMTKVLTDGGSGLNILFAGALKEFVLTVMDLTPPHSPFYGLIPGEPATPLGHITLPVTFGDRSNYRTEHLQITVADFDTAYHAILGRPALAKFMAVSHYVYLKMKMPRSCGVITVPGDVRVAYTCEREILNTAAALALSSRMDEVLTAFKQVDPEDLEIPTKKPSKDAIKPKPVEVKKVSLGLDDAGKTVTIGANLDPK
ncbi:unnamed protein product [Urochloa humidicola]